MPAEKACWPAPVRMTARTAASIEAFSSSASSFSSISKEKALCFCGRFSVNTSSPSSWATVSSGWGMAAPRRWVQLRKTTASGPISRTGARRPWAMR